MQRERVILLGAAGRDFHNFNQAFRRDSRYEVVGFTATQIPKIAGRVYPPELSGELYPNGIHIYPEDDLERLIRDLKVNRAIMAYSDVSHDFVMHLGSRVLASGADFMLMGPASTMLTSKKPVVAVCAVRTGCGKSQTARYVTRVLTQAGKKVVAIRHPMPYGDLARQKVERLATYEDLASYECTIEEREEYEAHINLGTVVYAGVDYEAILNAAEREADVIIWDGGNNDLPFIKPDLWITVADPLRPGHELSYHPGEANFRAADVIVINKANTAPAEAIAQVEGNARAVNPRALVVRAASEVTADNGEALTGKRVLVVEDGPTLTHGGMPYGAGKVAAEKHKAKEIIDPRPFAVGSIKEAFNKYPQMGHLVPAMGYYQEQIADLEETIKRSSCEVVVIATPIDLGRLIKISQPTVRVSYELLDLPPTRLSDAVNKMLTRVQP
ncbi:MAG: cyclic 2,3-diphosphoglycerate synthase [Pseudomonadota bacterium]